MAQELPNRGFDNCGWEYNLCRDLPGYSIGNHTDRKSKHITLLVYLAGETGDGTVLKDTPFSFVPNTALMFVPMDNTVHRVDKVSSVRHTLQLFFKESVDWTRRQVGGALGSCRRSSQAVGGGPAFGAR